MSKEERKETGYERTRQKNVCMRAESTAKIFCAASRALLLPSSKKVWVSATAGLCNDSFSALRRSRKDREGKVFQTCSKRVPKATRPLRSGIQPHVRCLRDAVLTHSCAAEVKSPGRMRSTVERQ